MTSTRTETRRSAAEAGRVKFLGKPCRRCGAKIRYTSSGACIACDRARQRRFLRMLKRAKP